MSYLSENNKNILKYLKYFENFEEKGIPGVIKSILPTIRKDLKNNGNKSFYKLYNISELYTDIQLEVEFIKSSDKIYYSNINILEILNDLINEINKPISIKITIKDQDIDVDYLLSVLSHEIRHIYDLYTVNNEYEMKDFVKSMNLPQFKDTKYQDFTMLIYLSLEHELIARNNMIYPRFRWMNITNKDELIRLYKNTYSNEALSYLKNFNYIDFVNKFDKKMLIEFTNIFIKDVANETNYCNNKEELLIFYKKWDDFFKQKSEEYSRYVYNVLDDIIKDINDNKFNENLTERNASYQENNIQGTKKIFKSIYKRLFGL